jgi:hypothetical protein
MVNAAATNKMATINSDAQPLAAYAATARVTTKAADNPFSFVLQGARKCCPIALSPDNVFFSPSVGPGLR